MKIEYRYFLAIIFKIIFIIDETYSEDRRPILIIICYDGFRPDYLDRGITPHLNNFKDNGVSTPFLKTVYPPLAVPACHSIATGLYPQNHGLIMRKNGDTKGTFPSLKDVTQKEMYETNKTTPIWALNEKNGGKSACIMWPGTEEGTTYEDGGTCSLVMNYDKKKTFKERADKMIEFLNDTDNMPNLVMFYIEQLDRITHFFGPLSRNSSLIIRRLDLLTKYIITKLIDIRVYHRTNIIILSDHGMQPIRTAGLIPTDEMQYDKVKDTKYNNNTSDVNGVIYVELEEKKIGNYSFTVEEFLKLSRQKNKYQIVKIPPGINGTISRIEYAACPNFIFNLESWKAAKYSDYAAAYTSKNKLNDPPASEDRPFGAHGYLRQNDAIFMGKGPGLAMFKRIEPFEMVDLYSAFTRLLNIKGDFEKDGNYSRVLPLFVNRKPVFWPVIIVTIAGIAVVFSVVFHLTVQVLLNLSAEASAAAAAELEAELAAEKAAEEAAEAQALAAAKEAALADAAAKAEAKAEAIAEAREDARAIAELQAEQLAEEDAEAAARKAARAAEARAAAESKETDKTEDQGEQGEKAKAEDQGEQVEKAKAEDQGEKAKAEDQEEKPKEK